MAFTHCLLQHMRQAQNKGGCNDEGVVQVVSCLDVGKLWARDWGEGSIKRNPESSRGGREDR